MMMIASIALTSALVAAAADTASQVQTIRTLIVSGGSIEAGKRVTELHRALVSKVSPARCRQVPGEKMAPNTVEPLLDSLEAAVSKKNDVEACQYAALLGAALQESNAKLAPAAKLAQIEKEWLRAGGPQDLESLDQLAWAYYDAGNFSAAREFAGSVLQKSGRLGATTMQLGYFEHSARTVLGLVRLESGSTRDAVVFLNQSLDVQMDVRLLADRPAVRLADALWKKGEQEAVVRYLTRASRIAWTSATPSVQKWLAEAQSGKAPSFFGPSGPAGK